MSSRARAWLIGARRVTGLLDRLVYLSAGLSVILAFIGVKLASAERDGRFGV